MHEVTHLSTIRNWGSTDRIYNIRGFGNIKVTQHGEGGHVTKQGERGRLIKSGSFCAFVDYRVEEDLSWTEIYRKDTCLPSDILAKCIK